MNNDKPKTKQSYSWEVLLILLIIAVFVMQMLIVHQEGKTETAINTCTHSIGTKVDNLNSIISTELSKNK